MKDSVIETRGKSRQDHKAQKEDPEDDVPKRAEKKAARSEPHHKRGRARKAESKDAAHDESDPEEHSDDEEESPKKIKQLKQVHDSDEVMNNNGHNKPAQAFEDFAQQLQNEVTVEEIQALLQENGLDTLESDEQLYQRSADLLFFGTCATCPSCGGVLEFLGQTYHCSGYTTDWAKCTYTTAEGRKGGHAKVPSKLKNAFLKSWVRCHAIVERKLDPAAKPFSGMIFVLGGRMSRPQGEIKKVIEMYGGRVVNSAREGITAFLVPEIEVSRGGTFKLAEATKLGLPICRETWLNDSIEKMQAQPLVEYHVPMKGDVIPWDKRAPQDEAVEALVAELKLVGKSGVYKDSKLQDEGGKIYEKGDIIYNCALSVCDIHLDLNQYAVVQLIEVSQNGRKKTGRRSDPKEEVYLYVKEGRVGDRRGVRERLDKQETPQAAVREFNKVFEQLTGNKFLEWEREKKFTKQRNKYFPIDMAPGVDARAGALMAKAVGLAAAHTKVDPRVVQFLKILFSQSVYRYAMSEIGVDAPDLPTGNLTHWHINLCQKYLVEFCEFLKKGDHSEQKKEQACLDFSNKWFTLLHSTRPFVFHDLGQLADLAAPTLEAVRDISHASELLGDMTTADKEEDLIAERYAKMDCSMTPLDREGDDYEMILKYFSTTMEPLKYAEGEFRLVVEDIVQLDSKAAPSLEEIQQVPNRMLLWSGMRTSNLLAALHRGMLPAPFDAPASCYSFGKGIYFTDAACKAAQYGFTAVDRTEGFLLLSIVGLGNLLELPAPEKPVQEYEEAGVCVKINGKKAPDSEEFAKWKYEVTVPCGTLKDTNVEGVQDFMDFNEYVAYSPQQVKPMFLVKTKFEIVK